MCCPQISKYLLYLRIYILHYCFSYPYTSGLWFPPAVLFARFSFFSPFFSPPRSIVDRLGITSTFGYSLLSSEHLEVPSSLRGRDVTVSFDVITSHAGGGEYAAAGTAHARPAKVGLAPLPRSIRVYKETAARLTFTRLPHTTYIRQVRVYNGQPISDLCFLNSQLDDSFLPTDDLVLSFSLQ